MKRVEPPVRCGSYTPGHEIHVIQARLSWESPPIALGTATVEPDGWVAITLDSGEELRRWIHEPVCLAQHLELTKGRVELRVHRVLAVESRSGHRLFCLAEEPTPCPSPDEDTSAWSPAELVLKRGGSLTQIEDS